jgi:two-component system alkaline phosphatase synthesis response regulator PhoP
MNKKILIVDDEKDILDLLEYNLTSDGYQVFLGRNGQEAIDLAAAHQPDLIILDIMMPVMDGIQACEQIRKRSDLAHTPVVFLTARTEEYAELAGFEAGGDDYIVKPVKTRVLLKRIKALLRRGKAAGLPVNLVRIHELEINKEEYTVKKEGQEVELTRREFELLYYLASRPGKLFNRQELLDKIWGNVHITDRTVDVHVRKLREKLGEKLIITVKGVGYKFMPVN